MTKREIIKWLELKKAESIKNAQNNCTEILEDYKKDIAEKLHIEEISKQVASKISEAADIINKWLDNIDVEGIEVYAMYDCIKNTLDRLSTAHAVKYRMYQNIIDNSVNLSQLKDNSKQITIEIENNYAAVIANVQQLKDAKLSIAYLQELGFKVDELMELNTKTTNALSVPVDIRFLFVQAVDNGS